MSVFLLFRIPIIAMTDPHSQFIKRVAAMFACALLVGCGEQQADRSTPQTHQTGGIIFEYPKNWTVSEPLSIPNNSFVIVESPGNALAILQAGPKEIMPSLADHAKEFTANAEGEMPMGKITSGELVPLPQAHGYDWLSQDFVIHLMGQAVPHRRLYGSKDIGDRRVILLFQVANEDATRTTPGFDLLRDSLRAADKAIPKPNP